MVMSPKFTRVATGDQQHIAVWSYKDAQGPPVLLAHGTFSNGACLQGLARSLLTRGFQPFWFDWRGRGASSHPKTFDFSWDDIALQDLPVVVRHVQQTTGRQKLLFVGHSGGALAAAMWASRHPAQAEAAFQCLVMLGAQASHAGRPWRQRLVIGLLHQLLRWVDRPSAAWLGVGPDAESGVLMRQWCRWQLDGKMHMQDGFDCLSGLAAIQVPVLALAGAGDRFIAPAPGCEALLQAFGGSDKSFVLCGVAQGFSEDYTHARILLSRAASREIWPLIGTWLAAQG